jgi:hypothetical protein
MPHGSSFEFGHLKCLNEINDRERELCAGRGLATRKLLSEVPMNQRFQQAEIGGVFPYKEWRADAGRTSGLDIGASPPARRPANLPS